MAADLATGGYAALRVEIHQAIAWVTIDHPPINLLDATLREEIDRLSREIASDDRVRVIVFQSANPDYFIAHADVNLFVGRSPVAPARSPDLNWIHSLGERLRTLPKVTIAKVEGRARGGGSEFTLNLDMRFAARGRAIFSQPEVALGIIPGGGATQRLPALMGRGRTLEAILGCDDFDADLAERYGWINRALAADDISAFVQRLATRIASFPETAIAQAKLAIAAAQPSPVPGLLEEAYRFTQSLSSPVASEVMGAFLRAGGQTREYELNLAARLGELAADEGSQSQP